jgi:hypothetical protein
MHMSRILRGKNEPIPDDANPVVVVYRKPISCTDRLLQLGGAGRYTHCEIYLPLEQASFAIFQGTNMQCSVALPKLYRDRPDLFNWHMFALNTTEYSRLKVWNVEQVSNRCAYNLSDLAYKLLPTGIQSMFVSDVGEQEARNPHKLYCSQAVVLALREACSGPGGSPHIAAFAHSMNSRLTTPTELAYKTSQFMGMPVNIGPVPMSMLDCKHFMNRQSIY